MAVSEEILDNLPWFALTGRQSSFAVGPGLALRYRRSVSSFCATGQLDGGGWQALAEMVGPGRAVVLFQATIGDVPDQFNELGRYPTYQMVADGLPTLEVDESRADVVRLGPDDAQEMMDLVSLTEPGPFFTETHQLGTYLGVREEGRLIAMAGERLQTDQVSEISAVCTHPGARRRGLAALLTSVLMDEIRERGQLPLLHVAETNIPAVKVYEQLGFRVRRDITGLAARVKEPSTS